MANDTQAAERHKADLWEWYRKELNHRQTAFLFKPSTSTWSALMHVMREYRQAAEGGHLKIPRLEGYM